MPTISNTPSSSALVTEHIRQTHFKLIEIVNKAKRVQSLLEDNQFKKVLRQNLSQTKKLSHLKDRQIWKELIAKNQKNKGENIIPLKVRRTNNNFIYKELY